MTFLANFVCADIKEDRVESIKCYEHIGHHVDLTAFVQEHATLVNKMAWHIKNRLPVYIELDDLIQSGLIGLLEAKRTFSEYAGASFTTFASLKVRFAMYEFVRKNSGITRDISQNIKKISESVAEIESQSAGVVSDQAVANKLGVSLKKYTDMMREISAYKSISMHEVVDVDELPCENTMNPLNMLEEDDEKLLIQSMLLELPEREQLILGLYYNNQLNFKEIGMVMDLSEARISQIHSTLLDKLRRKLTYLDESRL
jgi:RNA polymerase sigma factor for flagellar operon FliA